MAVTSIADAKPFSSMPAARNPRLVRFALSLAEFRPKLQILHRKGAYMTHIDALSRIQAAKASAATFHAETLELAQSLRNDILQSQLKDSAFACTRKDLEAAAQGTRPYVSGAFGLNADNLLCRVADDHWRLCVGPTALLRVIALAHSSHLGAKATFDRFRRVAFSPHLLRHVKDFVRRCTHCQQTRTHRHRPYGALQPLPSPSTPFVTISCDFIVQLPPVRTAFDADLVDTLLVVTDTGTRRTYLLSGASHWSAERWSLRFAERLLPHIGWPRTIISDRDSRLTSQFWRSLNTRYGCELKFSTAHHKSDGQSERTVQSVEMALRGLCNDWADDWASHLPVVELLLGNREHASLNAAPNELVYGLKLRDPFTALQPISDMGTLPFPDRRVALREQALDHLASAQVYMKHRYDVLHQAPPAFAAGDFVWLNLGDGYRLPRSFLPPDRRLGIQRVGPYRIVRVVSPLAYELALPAGSCLHPVISVQHLEPYVPPAVAPSARRITAILKERVLRTRGAQYLVCFDMAGHDQWIPADAVTDPAVLTAWRDRQVASRTVADQDASLPPAAGPDTPQP